MERAAEQRVREEETEMMRTLVLENFEAEKRERVHKVERREAEKRELIESNRALLELRAKEAALVEQEEAMISVYKEKKARPERTIARGWGARGSYSAFPSTTGAQRAAASREGGRHVQGQAGAAAAPHRHAVRPARGDDFGRRGATGRADGRG